MIISEAQKAAARRNGAKSRGPKTEAGKRRSSRNGCKHNLRHWWLASPDAFATNSGIHQYTRTLIAPGESPDDFARLVEDLRALHLPPSPRAEQALQILAAATWMYNRAVAAEIALMDAETDRLAPLHPDADFHTLAFLALERIPIRLIRRCQLRYERLIDRAEDILDKERTKIQLQILRPAQVPRIPLPSPAPESSKTESRTPPATVFNTESTPNPEPKPSATPAPAPSAPEKTSKMQHRTRVSTKAGLAATARRIRLLAVVSTKARLAATARRIRLLAVVSTKARLAATARHRCAAHPRQHRRHFSKIGGQTP